MSSQVVLTMPEDTPTFAGGVARRRWVVVVHVNSDTVDTHPQLYMLPQVRGNFGKIVLNTVQSAKCNGFYFKDAQDNVVLPIRQHTCRARTREFMAGAIPGTVVYYYTTTEGPTSRDKVEKAVLTWEEANLDTLKASLAAFRLSTTLCPSELTSTLPTPEEVPATLGASVSPPKFAFVVVPAPHIKAKPKQHGNAKESANLAETAHTEDESTNHVKKDSNKVEPKKEKTESKSKKPKPKPDAKTAKQDDAKQDKTKSKASKRKHDLVDAAMKLAEAITKATQTQQTLKQAEQDVQEAKRLHVEAQELVETLKKGILGEL